eukprot:3318148-Prymnesium_polylepis.1
MQSLGELVALTESGIDSDREKLSKKVKEGHTAAGCAGAPRPQQYRSQQYHGGSEPEYSQ